MKESLFQKIFFPGKFSDDQNNNPGCSECNDRSQRYLNGKRNSNGAHQLNARAGEEVVDHVDSESADGQIGQHPFDGFVFHLYLFTKHKDGESHHHDVQTVVGEKQFKLFVGIVRQCRDMSESEECHKIADDEKGYRDENCFLC